MTENKNINKIMSSFGFQFNDNNAYFQDSTGEKIHFAPLVEIRKATQKETINKFLERLPPRGQEEIISSEDIYKLADKLLSSN